MRKLIYRLTPHSALNRQRIRRMTGSPMRFYCGFDQGSDNPCFFYSNAKITYPIVKFNGVLPVQTDCSRMDRGQYVLKYR